MVMLMLGGCCTCSILWLGIAPHISRAGHPTWRHMCKFNNLNHIGLAMDMYHDRYGCYPPAYLADESGLPMHSWRVLILPYLVRSELYDAYNFEEPWNGPNNEQLAEQSVKTYSRADRLGYGLETPNEFMCPATRGERRTTTDYVAIVGSGHMFNGSESRNRSEILDGDSETILIVEVINSNIHWMEPRDLTLDQLLTGSPTDQHLRTMSNHPGGFHALFCDGKVRFIRNQIPVETFKALLTIGGGEKVPMEEF